MAGYLLADSFGGLQSAENVQDSNRRQALAAAMNAATSGLQFGTEQARRQEVMDQEQKNWEKQFGLQRDAAALARQRAADEEWNRIQSNDLGKGYLKIMQEQGTAAGAKSHLDEVRLAQSDAAAGIPAAPPGMAPEDYFTTFHPGLKPGEVKALAGSALDARQQKETEYNHAQGIADTLNNFSQLVDEKTASDAALKKFGFFSNNPAYSTDAYKAEKARNDQLSAAHDKLAPIVRRLQDPKINPYIGTRVAPTPTGGYENNTPVPRHLLNQSPSDSPSDGFVPTTGGVWMKPTPATTPQASPSTAGRKYPPTFYERVNALTSFGIDPASAVRQTLGEYQQAQAAGSLP